MRKNQLTTYAAVLFVVGVVLAASGLRVATLAPFALLLVCPLMMIFMMRGMHGSRDGGEDHTGHGCEHDPTRRVEPPTHA